jgi:8-oxo-dGTP diphosphatase
MNQKNTDQRPSLNQPVPSAQVNVQVIAFRLWENSLQILLKTGSDLKQRTSLWMIPGGRLLSRTSPDQYANQILLQITGQSDLYIEQLYTYYNLEDRPDGQISICYFAMVPISHGHEIPPLESGYTWVIEKDLMKLPPAYREVGYYALRRLRYKLEYTAAGFQFLPDYFTLSELQKTYETILGEKLDKRNFRRRILSANVIEPTPQFRSGDGRPARFYRYRPDAVAEVKTRRLFP